MPRQAGKFGWLFWLLLPPAVVGILLLCLLAVGGYPPGLLER